VNRNLNEAKVLLDVTLVFFCGFVGVLESNLKVTNTIFIHYPLKV